VEESDFRYRYDVDSIIGVSATSVEDAEFLVQWKATGPGRRAPVATWQPAANLADQGSMPDSFLRNLGYVSLYSSDFPFPVYVTVPLRKKVKSKNSKLLYKCGATGCGYTSDRRSNMQSHEQTQHAVYAAGQTAIRFPCSMCNSTFGLVGAMTKHFNKFHQRKE